MYGFGAFQPPGYACLASASETAGTMMTSCPGRQFTGVSLRFLDVLRPLLVIGDRVHTDPDDLAVPLLELGFQPRHVAELGRANWGEVLRMREQDGPPVSDPLVEGDPALRSVGGKVGS